MRYIDAYRLKAEVERRNLTNYCGTAEQYEEELFAIIDSLQQEQPCEDLEEEIKRYWKEEMPVVLESDLNDIARHFYELGKQSKEPVNEDLEAKAAQYESYFDVGEQHGYLCVNKGEMAEAFKDGARWQKEQMLKDAVEGKVVELWGTYKDLSVSVEGKELNAVLQPLGVKDGDRVRVIIVKEDKL